MFISRESRFSLVLLEFNEVRKKIETMYELPSGKFAYQFSQHTERPLLICEFIQKKYFSNISILCSIHSSGLKNRDFEL